MFASIVLVLTGTFETLVAIRLNRSSSSRFYMSGFVSLLVLRRTEPDLPQTLQSVVVSVEHFVVVLLASAGFHRFGFGNWRPPGAAASPP